VDSKTKEFQAIMKATVEKTMTDKIGSFYNRSFDDHETVLFDDDPGDIGKRCIASLQTQMGPLVKSNIKTIQENVINYLKTSAQYSQYYNSGKKFGIYFNGYIR
jgi:hypothetical protein